MVNNASCLIDCTLCDVLPARLSVPCTNQERKDARADPGWVTSVLCDPGLEALPMSDPSQLEHNYIRSPLGSNNGDGVEKETKYSAVLSYSPTSTASRTVTWLLNTELGAGSRRVG